MGYNSMIYKPEYYSAVQKFVSFILSGTKIITLLQVELCGLLNTILLMCWLMALSMTLVIFPSSISKCP
jgi:hypothetical protein